MIGAALGVGPDELLTGDYRATEEARALSTEVDEIAKVNQGIDRDSFRQTLILLKKKSIDRLRTALMRGGSRRRRVGR